MRRDVWDNGNLDKAPQSWRDAHQLMLDLDTPGSATATKPVMQDVKNKM
jgi:hypothetical protein